MGHGPLVFVFVFVFCSKSKRALLSDKDTYCAIVDGEVKS